MSENARAILNWAETMPTDALSIQRALNTVIDILDNYDPPVDEAMSTMLLGVGACLAKRAMEEMDAGIAAYDVMLDLRARR